MFIENFVQGNVYKFFNDQELIFIVSLNNLTEFTSRFSLCRLLHYCIMITV